MEHLSHRTLLLLLIPVSMHPSDTHLGYSVQKVHLNKKYYVYNFCIKSLACKRSHRMLGVCPCS